MLGAVVPVHGDTAAGLSRDVDVLVRPEGLQIALQPGGNGIVTDRTFLGSVTRVSVRLSGDVTVKVDQPSTEAAAMPPGTSVQVSLPGRRSWSPSAGDRGPLARGAGSRRYGRGHAVQRERRRHPELGVAVGGHAGPLRVRADDRHVRGELPVQRGQVVTGPQRPGHGRGVVVDHGADDGQAAAGIDDLDQPDLARPVHDRARRDLPEPARRVVRVTARADGVGMGVPVQPQHHVAEAVQQGE